MTIYTIPRTASPQKATFHWNHCVKLMGKVPRARFATLVSPDHFTADTYVRDSSKTMHFIPVNVEKKITIYLWEYWHWTDILVCSQSQMLGSTGLPSEKTIRFARLHCHVWWGRHDVSQSLCKDFVPKRAWMQLHTQFLRCLQDENALFFYMKTSPAPGADANPAFFRDHSNCFKNCYGLCVETRALVATWTIEFLLQLCKVSPNSCFCDQHGALQDWVATLCNLLNLTICSFSFVANLRSKTQTYFSFFHVQEMRK